MAARKDPTPEEIAAQCLLIQATWTESERMSRLRADVRPEFRLADGRRQAMTGAVYRQHHEQRGNTAGSAVFSEG